MVQRHVLLLCEPGRSGQAALDHAREIAATEDVTLTAVAIAPHSPSGARCGNSAVDFNLVVTDAVAEDLARAHEQLAQCGVAVVDQMLVEGKEPSLERFARAGNFDLIVLPKRRWPLWGRRHPAAVALSRATDAEIRVVDSSHASHASTGTD